MSLSVCERCDRSRFSGVASSRQQDVEGEPDEWEGHRWADVSNYGPSRELADIDSIIDRSKARAGPVGRWLAVGSIGVPLSPSAIVIRDPHWKERDWLSERLVIVRLFEATSSVPAAALLFAVRETIESM